MFAKVSRNMQKTSKDFYKGEKKIPGRDGVYVLLNLQQQKAPYLKLVRVNTSFSMTFITLHKAKQIFFNRTRNGGIIFNIMQYLFVHILSNIGYSIFIKSAIQYLLNNRMKGDNYVQDPRTKSTVRKFLGGY